MAVYIFQRKLLQLCKCLCTDILNYPIRNVVVAQIHQPLRSACYNNNPCQPEQNPADRVKIHTSFSNNQINSITDQNRSIQCQQRRNTRKYE